MFLKLWYFYQQSTQVWYFIFHVSLFHIDNNLCLLFRGPYVDILIDFNSSCLVNLAEQHRGVLTTSIVITFIAANESVATSWIEHLIGFTVNMFLLLVMFSFWLPIDKWGSWIGGLLGASQIVKCFNEG